MHHCSEVKFSQSPKLDFTAPIGYALWAYPIGAVNPRKNADSLSRWEVLFRALRDRLSQPTAEHPCSRIWKETDLVGEIAAMTARHRGELKWTFPAGKLVVERMKSMGWLRAVALEPSADGKPPPVLYLVDMEATENEFLDARELLQGFQPAGVLCYFAVLALHELTTQVPAFAHVATLQTPPPRTALPLPSAPHEVPNRQSAARNPLGTEVFRYQGRACLVTKRDRSLVPGIQIREAGKRTWLRVTTLEQALLDTLLHPLRCGGEGVVFEAWERGAQRWNPARLASHLEAINRLDFDRRVGTMLEVIGVGADSEPLRARLTSARAQVKVAGDGLSELELLPDFTYSRLNAEWRVRVP